MTGYPRRSDYSRHLVADLLALAEDGAHDGVAAMNSEERAALFAAARDYTVLVPESCTRCGQALSYLQPEDPSEYSYDRGLRLVASGGYGMFIDPFVDGDPEILLCHPCAHAVCASLPWFATAIGADTSHSDGSSTDPAETLGWPTLEEVGALLEREPTSLLEYIDLVVVTRDSIARIRPAVVIALARRFGARRPDEVAEALLTIAQRRTPAHLATITAEIDACFLSEASRRSMLEPEDAAHFLAAVRRISPAWADKLDPLYRDVLMPVDLSGDETASSGPESAPPSVPGEGT